MIGNGEDKSTTEDRQTDGDWVRMGIMVEMGWVVMFTKYFTVSSCSVFIGLTV